MKSPGDSLCPALCAGPTVTPQASSTRGLRPNQQLLLPLQAWWVGEDFSADIWRVCINNTNCTEINDLSGSDGFKGERSFGAPLAAPGRPRQDHLSRPRALCLPSVPVRHAGVSPGKSPLWWKPGSVRTASAVYVPCSPCGIISMLLQGSVSCQLNSAQGLFGMAQELRMVLTS